MKKFFAILLTLLTFCCCNPIIDPNNPDNQGGNDKPDKKNGLSVSVQELKFPASGGEQTFSVTTKEKSWTAGVIGNWLLCSQNGNIGIVSVEPNTGEERTGSVHISAGDKSCDIKIIQEGKNSIVPLDPSGTADGYNPYPNADFKVSDNVVFLRDSIAKKITAVDENAMTFTLSKNTPKEFIPSFGQKYIINQTDLFPDGMLAMVQDVTETSNGYMVRYSKIGLLDCFENLNINEEINLSECVQKVLDANGKEIKFDKTRVSTSPKYKLIIPQIPWDIGAGIELTPKMTLDISMMLKVEINSWMMADFDFVADVDADLSADLGMEIAGTDLVTYNKKLYSIICGTAKAGPILITPKIDIYAHFDAGGGLNFVGSISYFRGAVAKMHYSDLGSDIDGDMYLKDNEKFNYTAGPKVSGTMRFGLDYGPSVGIYGNLIASGFHIGSYIRAEASHMFNPGNLSIGQVLMGSELELSYAMDGSLFFEGLGFPKHKSLKDVKWPFETRKIIPTISDNCTIEADGRDLTFTTWVKNKAVFYPPLKLKIKSNGGGEDLDFIDFTYGKIETDALEAGADSVRIQARTTIAGDSSYSFDVYGELFNENSLLKHFMSYAEFVDKNENDAMKEVVADIYASRIGDWEGCDWIEPNRGVANMAQIQVFRETSGRKRNVYRISIPPHWNMTDNITVSNHCGNAEGFIWELEINGERHFNKVDIEDAACKYAIVGDDCDTYILRSKNPYLYLPIRVNTVDLAGSGIKQFKLLGEEDEKDNCTVKKLILDNCNDLESIEFSNYQKSSKLELPIIYAKNCPKLKTVSVNGLDIKNGCLDNVDVSSGQLNIKNIPSVSDISVICDCGVFSLSDSKINNLTFSGQKALKKIYLSHNEVTGSVIISGIGSLEEVSSSCNETESFVIDGCNTLGKVEIFNNDGKKHVIKSVSVTDCASLKSLNCSEIGLTSLTIENVPVLEKLWCGDNHELCGLMLPIFDQMFNAGFLPSYDIRYIYSNYKMVKDNGYGFYYSDEPERGYHR